MCCISVRFRNFSFWPMPVAWFFAGYVLEDALAIVKLRTGSLEIFPEAYGAWEEKLGEDQLDFYAFFCLFKIKI